MAHSINALIERNNTRAIVKGEKVVEATIRLENLKKCPKWQ